MSSKNSPSSQQLQQATSSVVSCPTWVHRMHLFSAVGLGLMNRVFLFFIPVILLTGCFAEAIEMTAGVIFVLVLPVVATATISTAQMLFAHCLCPRFLWGWCWILLGIRIYRIGFRQCRCASSYHISDSSLYQFLSFDELIIAHSWRFVNRFLKNIFRRGFHSLPLERQFVVFRRPLASDFVVFLCDGRNVDERATCHVVRHVNTSVHAGERSVLSFSRPLTHVTFNCVQQKKMGSKIEHLFAPTCKSLACVSCVVLVFCLVKPIDTILCGIMDDTSRNYEVLVLVFHVGVGTHAEQFFSEHHNRLGVTNQTADALRKLGMILARRGSTICPEVVRGGFFHVRLDRHTQVFIDNQIDFTLKQFNGSHSKLPFLVEHSLP